MFVQLQNEIDKMLARSKYSESAGQLIKSSFVIGSVLSLAVLCSGLFFQNEKISLLFLPAFFIPFILRYFHLLYVHSQRIKSIEEDAADVLLFASSLPEKAGIKRVVDELSSCGSNPIHEEFFIAKTEISKGSSVELALGRIKERNNSPSLSRAINLLVDSLQSGADMNTVFRETAEDFMQTNSILRERAANSAMQKYTLLFAGGLLVPIILGNIYAMASKLNFGFSEELGVGVSNIAKKAITEALQTANFVYIFEFAIIASVFVAFQQGQQSRAIIYAAVIVPLGLLFYIISSGV